MKGCEVSMEREMWEECEELLEMKCSSLKTPSPVVMNNEQN